MYFIISTLCVFLCVGCSREPEATKTPQEVSRAVFDSVITLIQKGEVSSRQDFEQARNSIATGLFETVSTDSLGRADSLVYGQLLFWSGRHDRARVIFEDLQPGDGEESRAALLELITMEIEVGDKAAAEGLMADYRKLYPPGPDNQPGLYDQCESLGGHYSDKGLIEDAIRVYLDELNSLPFDRPYNSFQLLVDLSNTCQEAGKLDLCEEQLVRCKEGLEKGLTAYVDTVSYADSTEKAEDRNPGYYKFYIKNCNLLLDRIDLIGKPAPELSFIHVFNADSTLTIESLRGTVAVLDFWTTWCLPCKIAFIELKVLRDEFKDKGLEIIGVTSLQGYYSNMETGEVEREIAPEREIELTSQFIEMEELTWPCAISKKNIFYNEYTVSSVPTFVLIDREGMVRFVQAFAGQVEQKRRIIKRLL